MLLECHDLVNLFNDLFKKTEQTILVGGAAEPLYLPKNSAVPFNQIIFTYDYFSSALHEVAHWCVAGTERRQLIDYGYWYKPDGRDHESQKIFEQVEAKPQALEWIFSVASGARFRVSADNIASNNIASDAFKNNIYQQTLSYLKNGLPIRAELFKQALLEFYNRVDLFNHELFLLASL